MEIRHDEKASYAFYTYVFNDYDNFVKPLSKYMSTSYTSDRSHEFEIQSAICKLLSSKIVQLIPSKQEIKQNFNKSLKALSKQELDLVEFNEKFKKIENKLETYFKLHYILEDIDQGNFELDHASLLMAIYSKMISLELKPNGKRGHCGRIEKIQKLKTSLIYQYLDNARKEAKYHTTLNQLSNLTMTDLVSWLYKSIAIFDYNNDNTILDPYIGIYDDRSIATTFNEVEVMDLENSPASYEEFIEIIENNFNEKLLTELHLMTWSLEK